jgi:hypothetical protein
MSKSRQPKAVTFSPDAKLILWINAALCLVTLTVMIAIAFSGHEPMPKAMERLSIVGEHVFTLTSGAFVGFFGGRVSVPDPPSR